MKPINTTTFTPERVDEVNWNIKNEGEDSEMPVEPPVSQSHQSFTARSQRAVSASDQFQGHLRAS